MILFNIYSDNWNNLCVDWSNVSFLKLDFTKTVSKEVPRPNCSPGEAHKIPSLEMEAPEVLTVLSKTFKTLEPRNMVLPLTNTNPFPMDLQPIPSVEAQS